MTYQTRKSLIPYLRHLAGFKFSGIALAAVTAALLVVGATPVNALTFSWSFVMTSDSDDPGETISGLIWGLHEGLNSGSDVHASVTSTPNGALVRSDWEFYTSMPQGVGPFIVTGGVLTYVNAGFLINGQLGGPELLLSLNDDIGYSSPKLDDQEDTWWYAGFEDNTAFSPKNYFTLKLEIPWILLGSTLNDPDYVPDPKLDPIYNNYLRAAYANEASTSFAAAPEIPLPAALPLLAAGLGAMGFAGWRKKRKASSAA